MPLNFDLPRNGSRLALTTLACLLAGSAVAASAGAPQYHLTRLDIAGAQSVYVADINDFGEMVGYYIDADSLQHAFLWDANGEHDLGAPESSDGGEVHTAATAINNAGQIVGYGQVYHANFDPESSPGLLWTTAQPGQFQRLSSDDTLVLSPYAISDNGTVVGLRGGFQTGEAFHGFVWTAADGVVDYGTTDTSNPDINASWSDVNDAGQLVGVWNFQFAPAHAAVGTVGTPAMLPLSDASDAVTSSAIAINASGERVGYMALDGTNAVPVVFAADGSASAIDGATLGLAAGQALGLNDAGAVVGRASDFSTLEFKAFVAVDGISYDLFNQVDDTAGFTYFLTAKSVNAAGSIVGLARYGDFQVGSYVLTPVASDEVFSNGFDG